MAHIYKTLAPPVFKYVLSNSGTREEAKDLFQEAYLKVLNNVQSERYRDQDKFEAYFFTIVRNTWIDYLRRKRKHQPLQLDETLWQSAEAAEEDALVQLVLHDQRLNALHNAWQQWADTNCRRILQRFHYDQIRTKDIAQEEGISQNTLLQRLFKCRTKLFRLVQSQLDHVS